MSYIEDNRELVTALVSRKISVTTTISEVEWRLFEIACHAFDIPSEKRSEILAAAVFNLAAGIIRDGGEDFDYLAHLRDFAIGQMIDRERGWPNGRPSPDAVQFD
jgi:hypothetical protein